MPCEKDAQIAIATSLILSEAPKRSFKDAIDEVRRAGRPMRLDLAESTIGNLGGIAELGRRIVEDLKEMRGEDLPPELRVHHPKHEYYGHIRGLYGALIGLAEGRDELVGAADPFDGVSEEDMMAVASQAAMLRLEKDPDFLRETLRSIVRIDPDAVVDAAAAAIDILDARPTIIEVPRGR